MTIDEAIEQFKEDAEYNRADLDLEWAEENEQVAEWLEELKAMRNLDKTNFSDGYNKALEDVYTKAKEMQLEQINNLEQLSKRNGKMWARYMVTYLGHIENACKRLLKDGGNNDN